MFKVETLTGLSIRLQVLQLILYYLGHLHVPLCGRLTHTVAPENRLTPPLRPDPVSAPPSTSDYFDRIIIESLSSWPSPLSHPLGCDASVGDGEFQLGRLDA